MLSTRAQYLNRGPNEIADVSLNCLGDRVQSRESTQQIGGPVVGAWKQRQQTPSATDPDHRAPPSAEAGVAGVPHDDRELPRSAYTVQ